MPQCIVSWNGIKISHNVLLFITASLKLADLYFRALCLNRQIVKIKYPQDINVLQYSREELNDAGC